LQRIKDLDDIDEIKGAFLESLINYEIVER